MEETEKLNFEEEGVNEMMEELKQKLNKAVQKKKVKTGEWKMGSNKWWNEECNKEEEKG